MVGDRPCQACVFQEVLVAQGMQAQCAQHSKLFDQDRPAADDPCTRLSEVVAVTVRQGLQDTHDTENDFAVHGDVGMKIQIPPVVAQ